MSNEDLKKVFGETLNKQGHSFAQAVLTKAEELSLEHSSNWNYQVSEFPVESNGRNTRIDFILQRRREPIYMIAECKRVNPAFNNWVFVNMPYVRRQDDRRYLILERPDRQGSTRTCQLFVDKQPYQHCVEVRSDCKGDPTGGKSDVFEDACSQVAYHINGYVNALARIPALFGNDNSVTLLPVIFTTAKIWTSNVDLKRTDVETGIVSMDGTELQQEEWILFRYHMGPGVKHSAHSAVFNHPSIGDAMNEEYVRTIPIVSATGIASFLRWANLLDFD